MGEQSINEQMGGMSGADTLNDFESDHMDNDRGGSGLFGGGGFGNLFSFLTKRPEGSVEERMDHALNFDHSRGMARMIRGIEAIVGELNFAVVDIVAGFLEWKKGAVNSGHDGGPNDFSA